MEMDSSGFDAEMLPPVLKELDLLTLVFATRKKVRSLHSTQRSTADSVLLVWFLPWVLLPVVTVLASKPGEPPSSRILR